MYNYTEFHVLTVVCQLLYEYYAVYLQSSNEKGFFFIHFQNERERLVLRYQIGIWSEIKLCARADVKSGGKAHYYYLPLLSSACFCANVAGIETSTTRWCIISGSMVWIRTATVAIITQTHTHTVSSRKKRNPYGYVQSWIWRSGSGNMYYNAIDVTLVSCTDGSVAFHIIFIWYVASVELLSLDIAHCMRNAHTTHTNAQMLNCELWYGGRAFSCNANVEHTLMVNGAWRWALGLLWFGIVASATIW